MEQQTLIQQSPEVMIKRFISKFRKAFGTTPFVTYHQKKADKVSLDLIKQAVNQVLESEYPFLYINGIENRCRDTEVVEPRQVYFKVAIDLGHTYSIVAKSLGRNHATVIHAYKKVTEMLRQNDATIFYIYSNVLETLNKLTNNEENICTTQTGRDNSQSDISS